jgi:hypothetical protein
MSATVAIDPGEMKDAAKKVDAMFTDANDTAHALRGLDTAIEMPPGIAARVEGVVTSAASSVARAALSISCVAAELARRGEGAEQADQINKLAGGLLSLAGIAKGGAALGINHPVTPLPAGAVPWVKGAGRGITGLGVALSVGSKLASDVPNPYLTKDQVATRAAKAGAIGLATGLPAAAAVAVVVAAGGPVGVAFVAGLAVGVTVSVLDQKFHISDRIDDGIDDAADDVKDTVNDVADGVHAIKDNVTHKIGHALSGVL